MSQPPPSSPSAEILTSWRAAARLVTSHRDVLDARVWDGTIPEPLERRGWSEFLLALGDDELALYETGGIEASSANGAPETLIALQASVREVCALGRVEVRADPIGRLKRGETPRKRRQVEAFAQVVRELSRNARRVLDLGSGHGHLTREIAEAVALPVIGLERDARLARRARSLSKNDAADFVETDVVRDGIELHDDDCVIGLHACGELGDVLVERAAQAGARVALVGCCLQKRSSLFRSPLVARRRLEELCESALDLPRALLGLSNLTAREEGVERSRDENLAGRRRRLALHFLLSERGTRVPPGAELMGLNRRAAHGDLTSMVARAFAHRGIDAPSRDEMERALRWADLHHGRARRLSLPRALLARPIEILVLLDRALFLEDLGYRVTVGALFPPEVSARNLVLIGERVP